MRVMSNRQRDCRPHAVLNGRPTHLNAAADWHPAAEDVHGAACVWKAYVSPESSSLTIAAYADAFC